MKRNQSVGCLDDKKITFCCNRELVLETFEIDEGRKKSRGLDIGVEDEYPDKVVQWRHYYC